MDEDELRVYRMKANILKALAHPIRLAIVDLLKGGEQCVCDIAEHVGSERSNVSRHLSVLLKAGVLQSRKDGLKVRYSLRLPCVTDFLACATRALREHMEATRALLKRL